MKKDIIIFVIAAAVIAAFIGFSDIQSVDEYYLTHLEDIRPDSKTVTLSIRCDTVLDNYDRLDPALRSEEYVPKDGIILAPTKYVLRDGDSVYDVLDRAVRHNKIQVEYHGLSKNSYSGVYVKGMNYLYEFSCGDLSGWMYRVNGVFPSYGCSLYKLCDGDVIEWVYSCALGTDVGDTWKEEQNGE